MRKRIRNEFYSSVVALLMKEDPSLSIQLRARIARALINTGAAMQDAQGNVAVVVDEQKTNNAE